LPRLSAAFGPLDSRMIYFRAPRRAGTHFRFRALFFWLFPSPRGAGSDSLRLPR